MKNLSIIIPNKSDKEWSCLITDIIPDYQVVENGKAIPRWMRRQS